MVKLSDVKVDLMGPGRDGSESYVVLENFGSSYGPNVTIREYVPFSGQGVDAEFYVYVYTWDEDTGRFEMDVDRSRRAIHNVEMVSTSEGSPDPELEQDLRGCPYVTTEE